MDSGNPENDEQMAADEAKQKNDLGDMFKDDQQINDGMNPEGNEDKVPDVELLKLSGELCKSLSGYPQKIDLDSPDVNLEMLKQVEHKDEVIRLLKLHKENKEYFMD